MVSKDGVTRVELGAVQPLTEAIDRFRLTLKRQSPLWSIPDEPTKVLMERFYENQWSKKMGALDAMVEAQQWMLREGRAHAGVQRGIQRLEKTSEPMTTGRLPPYYWAAFVLSGDWR